MKRFQKIQVTLLMSTFFLAGLPSVSQAYSAGAPSIYLFNPTIGTNGSEVSVSSGYPGFGARDGAVYLDEILVEHSYWSDSKVVFLVPVAISAGMHNVTIRNSTGELSKIKQFRTQPAPEIFNVIPSDIYPGVTWMCIVGNSFGSKEDNWREGISNLYVGSINITSAAWADKKICFTAPEGALPVVKIDIGKTPVTKNFSFASIPYINDTLISKQYYLDVVNARGGGDAIKSNVIVAVIDDGIYLNHPDLKNNIWVNQNEIVGNKIDDDKNGYVDDVYGWNFFDDNEEMTVRGSHGTHVAGIIGAESNNKQGISGVSGNTKLMSLIACNKTGCNRSAVIKAIRYAADQGASVVNLSLGSAGTMGYSAEYDSAVRHAYNKGVVIVAAAGNGDIESAESIGGDLSNIPQSPVCNDFSQNAVLGVSGIDDQKNVLRWANYGACVDVYAPGIKILSTAVPALEDGSFYSSVDGTSFSAPIVAGLAAQIKVKYPQITNREIIDRIIQTSQNNLGIKTVDVSRSLTAPYASSNLKPFIPGSNDNDSPVPPKSSPSPKAENPKPKAQVEPVVTKLDSTNVFSYDTKLATLTPLTRMSLTSGATLRSCPSKTCDPKGIYPNDSLFNVSEKYGSKDTWYRGEMPDGNTGWISSELLTLASFEAVAPEDASLSTATPMLVSEDKTKAFDPYTPKKPLWYRIASWFKFW